MHQLHVDVRDKPNVIIFYQKKKQIKSDRMRPVSQCNIKLLIFAYLLCKLQRSQVDHFSVKVEVNI